MGMNTETSLIMKPLIKLMTTYLYSKPGIHYTIFKPKVRASLQIWADTSNRKSHSVWRSQLFFLALDFDSIQSEEIKHVWYFQQILEHILF